MLFGECPDCHSPLNWKGECTGIIEMYKEWDKAATLSGLYNCQLCGEEKCEKPEFCENCLRPPKDDDFPGSLYCPHDRLWGECCSWKKEVKNETPK